MTRRSVEVHCKDFPAADPPRHIWRVTVWQPGTEDGRRISAAVSAVEYGTERDAAAAAEKLAVEMGLPLDSETRHEKAGTDEYRERGYLMAAEATEESECTGTQETAREPDADDPGETYRYAGWHWYLREWPRLEWRLFRRQGWRWYFGEWLLNGWMWEIRNFRWRLGWHIWRSWRQNEWMRTLRRVRLASAIKHYTMTEEERKANDRERWIQCIEMFGGRMRSEDVEGRPDGATVCVSFTVSYDPEADEFLESDHSYGDPEYYDPKAHEAQKPVYLEDFLRQFE